MAPAPAPPAPRRPLDLLLGGAGLLAVAAVLLVVRLTTDDTQVADPAELRALLPPTLLFLVAVGANLTLIVLVCSTAVRALLRGEYRHLLRMLAAGGLGYALASAINAAVLALSGPGGPPEAIAAPGAQGMFTDPMLGYLAGGIAYVRALPHGGLPRLRTVMWAGIVLVGASALLGGVTTALALLLTVLTGLTGAAIAGYAVGLPRPEPATDRLLAELGRLGLRPRTLTPAGGDAEGNIRFTVELAEPPASAREDSGHRVEAVVMSAENTAGFWKRLLGLLLLRGPVAPPMLYGVRRRAEHSALMSFAAREAGALVPRVLAVGELGAGTMLLVRECPRIRCLDDIADSEVTDDLLDGVWAGLARLHRHRIAHGNINGDTVGVSAGERSGGRRAAFTGLSFGSVAAPQLKMSLDTAALVTLLAMRVGPERAVHSAVRALGITSAAGILPFLQPAGLPYDLRARARARSGLLADLRRRITEVAPGAPATPARLERMRPRTVVSVVVATAVGLVLAYQLTGVDFTTIREADLGWTAAAFAMATLCMVAAAMVLVGFVPIRLPWWPTVLVQYAGSFVRIAAPAGLGSIAVNSRFVTQMGAPAPLALSAVGLTQLVGFMVHVPLLLVCAYLTGTSYWTGFSPSPMVIAMSAAGSVCVAAVVLWPRLRRAVLSRVGPYLHGVVPQLLDLLQRPGRLALGLGGTVLLTAAFILCLYFSVWAFAGGPAGGVGAQVSLVAVAVVYLAGNAIGSAAPTPGGLGAVEAALIGGLTAVAGIPAAVALPAVLLFRLLTFWLPVLPGWGAFHYLQRREAL